MPFSYVITSQLWPRCMISNSGHVQAAARSLQTPRGSSTAFWSHSIHLYKHIHSLSFPNLPHTIEAPPSWFGTTATHIYLPSKAEVDSGHPGGVDSNTACRPRRLQPSATSYERHHSGTGGFQRRRPVGEAQIVRHGLSSTREEDQHCE
jgi:hypothetical protein